MGFLLQASGEPSSLTIAERKRVMELAKKTIADTCFLHLVQDLPMMMKQWS